MIARCRMKYGVVGNREGWNKEFVLRFLRRQGITRDDTVISGGAVGVDSFSEEFAREIGCKLVVHKPNMQVTSPYRYRQRNMKIARECDVLIAFDKHTNSGTSQTIRFAKELGRKVIVVNGESDKHVLTVEYKDYEEKEN